MVDLHMVDGRTVTKAIGLEIDLPVVAMVAVDDRKIVACWGLAWNESRCFLWFHMEHSKPEYRFIVMREAKKMLRRAVQLGAAEVFVTRDASFPTSERLLKILGFEPSGIEDGKEVWCWRD